MLKNTVKKVRFVRDAPNHPYEMVGKLLGVSGRTVMNMVRDKRLKSTSLPDVVAYIRKKEVI